MDIYFTASQIPELRDLPQAARQLVVRRALDILRSRSRLFYWLPVLFCIVGAVGGAFLCDTLLAHFLHLPGRPGAHGINLNQNLLAWWLGLGLGFVTGFIGSRLQLWKLRPLLRGVINDYISKIYAA